MRQLKIAIDNEKENGNIRMKKQGMRPRWEWNRKGKLEVEGLKTTIEVEKRLYMSRENLFDLRYAEFPSSPLNLCLPPLFSFSICVNTHFSLLTIKKHTALIFYFLFFTFF